MKRFSRLIVEMLSIFAFGLIVFVAGYNLATYSPPCQIEEVSK